MEKNKFDLDTISIDKNIDSKNEVDRILENGISKKDIVIAKKNIRIAIIAVTEKGKKYCRKNSFRARKCRCIFPKERDKRAYRRAF